MDAAKRRRLEAAGFTVGDAAEFLELSPPEKELVEMKIALSAALKRRRREQHVSQQRLAELLHSSQSRVAKMEAGDAGVSLDLLIRALLVSGMTRAELADVLAARAEEPHTARLALAS
ncbi:MAG: helix-turn-helix transcriptional regulator [Armatimonadetes bacterium]|nr:helix-turn-helix transcriptional regulator [Armatimonadota bacterium]